MIKQYEWLPHLENSMTDDTLGYAASPYSISLEGWRRGLDLVFIKTKKKSMALATFELSDGENKYRYYSTRGSLVAKEAVNICVNKHRTKEYLDASNVPTPKGFEYKGEIENDEIVKKIKQDISLSFPLVIKPTDGTGGKGVIANIRNIKEFEENLNYVRDTLGYKNVIVEEHFHGEDYRVYVVGNEAVAATKRISPNVIGDGVSTIADLIKEKNNQRKEMKLYKSSLIKVGEELKRFLQSNGLSLDSIPKVGERVYVMSKNNVTAGGDPVDATDDLFPEAKEIAVRALKAIPGLPQGGVDLMVNHETKEATVIEINSRAHIRLNLFPLEGKGRDIPKAIVDYYFPNTTQNTNSPLYFDFGRFWRKLQNSELKQIEVPKHPEGELEITRFLVSGNVRNVNFSKWVEDIALDYNLHGFVKQLENKNVSIVICGLVEDIANFREIIMKQLPEEYKEYTVKEKIRKSPVSIGFQNINEQYDKVIIEGYYPVRLRDTEKTPLSYKRKKKSKPINNKNDSTINSDKNLSNIETVYQKKYYNIVNSTSWKLTKPLRLIGKIVKGKKI